jgi:hypothetical protein
MLNRTGKTTWLWRGGDGPKDIPPWAYKHLVTVLNVDPDFSSTLKCVEQITYLEGSLVLLIRIFAAEADQGHDSIRDFASLDRRPELVLFEGYMEKSTGRIVVLEGPGKCRLGARAHS